jgi:adenylate cyclase, class 2
VEIEKKYRLTGQQRDMVLARLPEIGATYIGEEFEINTLYSGGNIELGRIALRLRRTGRKSTLTYKERYQSRSKIKYQREDETVVEDPRAMHAILKALGYKPSLVYEKRRKTWQLGKAEVVVDELPFGLFMEIEGRESDIKSIQRKIGLKGLKAESATYPDLTVKYGEPRGDKIEAKFDGRRKAR